MTPEQVQLIKTSWAQVVPISDKAAELFYGRLFDGRYLFHRFYNR